MCVQQKGLFASPVAMDEQNILRQVIVKVYDELQIHHGFIALVYYRRVRYSFWVVDVGLFVYYMRELAQIHIQP